MPTATARLIRPDGGLPIILHASDQPRHIVVTSPTSGVVELHRHYDVNLSTLVPCECEPPCPSHRVETFAAGLALVERDQHGSEVWEEVLLQITAQAMVAINRFLLTKHQTSELRGAAFLWNRRTKDRNSAVSISWLGIRANVPAPFDIGWCLIKRRSISFDFFKEPRTSKPRVPLGQPHVKK